MKQTAIEFLISKIESNSNPSLTQEELKESIQQAKEMERELIKESCIMAIMQWNEWDKTNYLDLYDHKVEGAEIWAEDYCKELYEEIEVPNPKQETHICKYCNAETWQSDDECYANPKITNNHIVDANKKVSSIEWFSNQSYELFEQYSEGNFNRMILNKLMVEATEQAKEIHKQEIIDAYKFGISDEYVIGSEEYYNKTFGK
jgi:hypothetical protein